MIQIASGTFDMPSMKEGTYQNREFGGFITEGLARADSMTHALIASHMVIEGCAQAVPTKWAVVAGHDILFDRDTYGITAFALVPDACTCGRAAHEVSP